jgi:hypothetical protein
MNENMSVVDRLLVPYDCYNVEPEPKPKPKPKPKPGRRSMAPMSKHVEMKITEVLNHYKNHPVFMDLTKTNDIHDDVLKRFLVDDLHDVHTGNKVFKKTTQKFDASSAPSDTELIQLVLEFIDHSRD